MIKFLILLSFSFGIFADEDICKLGDIECLSRIGNRFYQKTFEVENLKLDPLYIENVEGIYSDMKFKFMNTTATGLKSCILYNVSLDVKGLLLPIEYDCSAVSFNGKYEMYGNVFNEPIEGYGDYTIDIKTYAILLNSRVELVQIDGETYLQFKHHFVKSTQDETKFSFTNLRYDQKETTDLFEPANLNKNEHLKDMTSLLHKTLLNIVFDSIMKNSNFVLLKVPLRKYHEL